MKKSLAAILSLVLALLMAVALFVFSAREEIAMVKVVKVKNDVLPSTVILESSLVLVSIPQANATSNMVTSLQEAKDKISTAYIGKDSYLYKYQIDSEVSLLGLKENEIPLRIPTDIISFGGARPGDYVDIIEVVKNGTITDKDGNKIPNIDSRVLVPNVRVINHVLGGGATRTLVHNQLYSENAVIQVNAENKTVPPMEVNALELPVAVDLAVSADQAKEVDKAIGAGSNVKLRLNPWQKWNETVTKYKDTNNTANTKPSTETPKQ